MIEVRDVFAGYTAEVDILRGMTLHAEQKEIVTLLGPNGCGKSTLLKTIAGYLLPRKGQVLLQGQDVSRVPVHEKIRRCRLGFVPQTDNVFASLSIRENLHVGGTTSAPKTTSYVSMNCARLPNPGKEVQRTCGVHVRW